MSDHERSSLTLRECMELAVQEARRCESETQGKVTPFVGAVVVGRDGSLLGSAYRGEMEPGEHAEYTLLEKKLGTATLAGASLFTTLEPCTERNPPKLPCVDRIWDRRVARAYIGMLDPNSVVRGLGVRKLQSVGIEVQLFDANPRE
jgi:pyrimidine deaminase RibD-like protein